MPTKSSFPDVEIPDVDLWGLMFDRKDRGFSEDKGTSTSELPIHTNHGDWLY